MAMSLQILQQPCNSFAEETSSPASLFEDGQGEPERETSKRFEAKWKSCPAPEKLEGEILVGTQQQVRNIKVCCDTLHIVVIFECFH